MPCFQVTTAVIAALFRQFYDRIWAMFQQPLLPRSAVPNRRCLEVSNQLNKLYLKFIKRNPGYDGKVSIYAHSLGSVLSYDILCHQLSLSSPLPMESIYRKLHAYVEPQIHAANRSSESDTSVDVDNKNAQCSDEAAVEQELPSTSQPSAAFYEEENTRNLHPIVTSDKEQVSSRTSPHPSLVEEKHTFSEKAPVINHAVDFSLSKEDGRVLVENSSPLIYQSTQDLDLNTNLERQASGGDKDGEAGDLSESVKDKDELISTLMEKVNLLKAKIAKLESTVVIKVGDHTVQETNKDQDDSRKSYTPYIKYTKLEFKVDTFFAVGSPLGVFLALRNIRIGIGKGKEYWEDQKISEEMPACRQMFNIFHPFDPVAYRVEPLVCKEFIGMRPVTIPYHKGGKRLHIGFQDFTEDLVVRSEAVVSQLNAMRVKMVNIFLPKNKDRMQETAEKTQVADEKTYGSLMMQRVTGSEGGRIDHMLQDKTFEHAYISAIGAHTNYWRDPDTALFILKHLYRDIPEELETLDNADASKDEGRPVGLIYEHDLIDEDLPLTFSDRSSIREFTRKLKKAEKIS